MILRNRIYT